MKKYQVILFLMIMSMGIVFLTFVNNTSATEKRARANAVLFAEKNSIDVLIMNCASDSTTDGYGTCTITATDKSKTHLECINGYIDVKLWKATGCKEKSLIQISE